MYNYSTRTSRLKWLATVLAVACLCGLPTIYASELLRSDFIREMPISFAGYTPSAPETLTNFPVLVVFSNNVDGSGFTYTDFMDDNGWDLRFVESDKLTELPYEIEEWNTNGASYIWVRVGQLVDSNTKLWAYWGNADLGQEAYTTNGAVWANGYELVWHMTEPAATDSTLYGRNGTPVGSVSNAVGKIATAQTFNGGGSNQVYAADYKGVAGTSSRTCAAWIKTAVKGNAIMSWGADSYGAVWDIRTEPALRLEVYGGYQVGTTSLTDDQWHLVTVVMADNGSPNVGGVLLYVDGEEESYGDTVSWPVDTEDEADFRVAAAHLSGRNFLGPIDEVRVSNVPRSSNWIWACWMNQGANDAFNACGDMQYVDSGLVFLIK